MLQEEFLHKLKILNLSRKYGIPSKIIQTVYNMHSFKAVYAPASKR